MMSRRFTPTYPENMEKTDRDLPETEPKFQVLRYLNFDSGKNLLSVTPDLKTNLNDRDNKPLIGVYDVPRTEDQAILSVSGSWARGDFLRGRVLVERRTDGMAKYLHRSITYISKADPPASTRRP